MIRGHSRAHCLQSLSESAWKSCSWVMSDSGGTYTVCHREAHDCMGNITHTTSLWLFVTLADGDAVELVCVCVCVYMFILLCDGQEESETTRLFIKLVGSGCCWARTCRTTTSCCWEAASDGTAFTRCTVNNKCRPGVFSCMCSCTCVIWPPHSSCMTLYTDCTVIFERDLKGAYGATTEMFIFADQSSLHRIFCNQWSTGFVPPQAVMHAMSKWRV